MQHQQSLQACRNANSEDGCLWSFSMCSFEPVKGQQQHPSSSVVVQVSADLLAAASLQQLGSSGTRYASLPVTHKKLDSNRSPH
jgi:hypothetical protein